MPTDLPAIVVTGASGLVGRHFLEAAKDEFLVYAIARRPQWQVPVAPHPRIKWIQVDIADVEALGRVMGHIRGRGGADYVLHLAAFFDFSNREDPEYERTNVAGTRNLLEQARGLGVRRFVFASSLAVTEFPPREGAITERSPADAGFPYALSKRKGEALVRGFSAAFPCSVVRLAAVLSDWCEYPPLYAFLSTWLSDRWDARILGGRGGAAIPYVHVDDVTRLFLAILRRSAALPSWDVYIGGGKGCTTQRELFDAATGIHFGRARRPLGVARPLARAGILLRRLAGRLTGRMPFERPWMARYIDRPMEADPSYTWKALGWEPAPRNHVLRRLPFLIERMKSRPQDWVSRNEAALHRDPLRPNLSIFEAMQDLRDDVDARWREWLTSPRRGGEFPHYRSMSPERLRWNVGWLYHWLSTAARTGNRLLLRDYVRALSSLFPPGDFDLPEVRRALLALRDTAVSALRAHPPLRGLEQAIQDCVSLPLLLAIAEIEALHERPPAPAGEGEEPGLARLERLTDETDEFYQPPPPGAPSP